MDTCRTQHVKFNYNTTLYGHRAAIRETARAESDDCLLLVE